MVGKQRLEDEQDRDIAQAWHIVHLYVKTKNDKRLPALSSVLPQRQPPRPQTVGEKKHVLRILSEQYGLKMRKKPPTRKHVHG